MASDNGSTIELLLPHDKKDQLVKYEVNDSVPAHQQKEFFAAFMTLISETRRSKMSMTEQQMILYAMKRKNVMPSECVAGFWDAFNDPYVPASGVEWRHIMKNIADQRGAAASVRYRHNLTADELEALEQLQRNDTSKPEHRS